MAMATKAKLAAVMIDIRRLVECGYMDLQAIVDGAAEPAHEPLVRRAGKTAYVVTRWANVELNVIVYAATEVEVDDDGWIVSITDEVLTEYQLTAEEVIEAMRR